MANSKPVGVSIGRCFCFCEGGYFLPGGVLDGRFRGPHPLPLAPPMVLADGLEGCAGKG